jgi:hypothetical protein
MRGIEINGGDGDVRMRGGDEIGAEALAAAELEIARWRGGLKPAVRAASRKLSGSSSRSKPCV